MAETTPRWDAVTYDRVAAPQERWGLSVLDRLPLRGGETVLDAGCGSGRVTEHLVRRLPSGAVIALDADPGMLDQARRRLASFGDRVSFVEADLGRPLPLEDRVDAVVSTATFHWVPDHDALFRHLAAVLPPGGRLEAQCGGTGNLDNVAAAVKETGIEDTGSRFLAGSEETERRLAAAGFDGVRCWLAQEPTIFDDEDTFEDFLATVCLRPLRDKLGGDYRTWVREIAARLGDRRLDYVRLNMSAALG